MVSRRDFLSTVAVGVAGMAAAPLLTASTAASTTVPAMTQTTETARYNSWRRVCYPDSGVNFC
ncbi:twin-arginine translocation signal domain-containing protein [Chromatiaceae bacterium AAb-1]|nr:twin-arginine translocation signal domain-containing protein [Chromatiaceae bacterium AAb-1]